MADIQSYLSAVKKEIKEVSVNDLKQKIDKKEDFLLIDVREKEETDGGIIPGAQTIVRGFLELKIENVESNKNRQIVINCAGGNRSALAAKALQELGYIPLKR